MLRADGFKVSEEYLFDVDMREWEASVGGEDLKKEGRGFVYVLPGDLLGEGVLARW